MDEGVKKYQKNSDIDDTFRDFSKKKLLFLFQLFTWEKKITSAKYVMRLFDTLKICIYIPKKYMKESNSSAINVEKNYSTIVD